MKMSVSARVGLLSATLLALVAGAVHGHDFRLIPDAFRRAPGELVQVRGQTSSAFPSSESAVVQVGRAGPRAFAHVMGHPLEFLPLTDPASPVPRDIVHPAIDRAGIWNIRALYLEPSLAGSGVDWETHWATLVFEVANGAAPLPGGQVES